MQRVPVQRLSADCWTAYFAAAVSFSVIDSALAVVRGADVLTTAHYTPDPQTFIAMSSLTQSRWWRYAAGTVLNLLDQLLTLGWDVQLCLRFERGRHSREQSALSAKPVPGDPFFIGDPSRKQAWTERMFDDANAEFDADRETPDAPARFRWLHLHDPHAPYLRGARGISGIDRYRAEIRHVGAQLGRYPRCT